MSSIMPLYHALFRKFYGEYKRASGLSDGSYSKTFTTARSRRSNGSVDAEDGIARPGLALLSYPSCMATHDRYDAKVVDDTTPPKEICVPNEKIQLGERMADDAVSREPDSQDTAGGFPWGNGSPV